MEGKEIQQILAENIKQARKQLNLTQSELAEMAGVSVGHMNDIERCRRWVGVENLGRLATALKLSPYQLFLPDTGSPHFDRFKALTSFSQAIKKGIHITVDEVLETLLNYGGSPDYENKDSEQS